MCPPECIAEQWTEKCQTPRRPSSRIHAIDFRMPFFSAGKCYVLAIWWKRWVTNLSQVWCEPAGNATLWRYDPEIIFAHKCDGVSTYGRKSVISLHLNSFSNPPHKAENRDKIDLTVLQRGMLASLQLLLTGKYTKINDHCKTGISCSRWQSICRHYNLV